MSEPGRIGTTARMAETQIGRAEVRVARTSADKLTGPRLGQHKSVALPSGWNLNILHRYVNNGINEYYVNASKDGVGTTNYYSQYTADGRYPGAYSTVRGSRADAFDDIKRWAKGLR